MNDLVISIHIPKCAGTTLAGILESVYGKRFFHIKGAVVGKQSYKDNLKDIKAANCAHGHMAYGLHEMLPDRSARYITFLRHPFERLLSYYWFIQGDIKNTQYAWTMRMTFREWLESQKLACLDNDMVRFLSGREYFNYAAPKLFVTEGELEKAKNNLSKFAFVGFSETFDNDIYRLCDTLEVARISGYKNERVSQDRPALSELSSSTIALLKEKQKYDLELYEWAKNNVQTNA